MDATVEERRNSVLGRGPSFSPTSPLIRSLQKPEKKAKKKNEATHRTQRIERLVKDFCPTSVDGRVRIV
jgi:hypothetical protein